MSLKIDEVLAAMRDNGVPTAQVAAVEKELIEIEADKKEERQADKKPKSKNQFVIVLNADGTTGYVLQLDEKDDANTAIDRVKRAVKAQNTTMKKFIKAPLKTFADAMENLKRKFSKVEGVLIKTPSPVILLKSDGTV